MSFFENIDFVHPWMLALALIPIAAIIWGRIKKRDVQVYLNVPDLGNVPEIKSWKLRLYPIVKILNYLAIALLIVAMARPQKTLQEQEIKAEGIDIMLVMDVSSSMLAKDFDPDRLESSKVLATDFVNKRPYDRIGLAIFAGESYTQSPLTTDHKVIKQFLSGIRCGLLKDGTAIGMGLAAGVNRLKDSKAKSKIVILLTDGVNNSGYIQPMTAAEIAKEFDVKVYTIGVGTMGTALSPIAKLRDGSFRFGRTRVEIDEQLLKEISNLTGGQYFRATSHKRLQEIYNIIDRLEKTEMDITVIKRYEEYFYVFAGLGLILLLLSGLMKSTLFRVL